MNAWRPPPEHPSKYERVGGLLVESRNRRLALHRGFMDCAIAEVDQLFGVAHRKARADAGVAGVGGRGGIAAPES